MSIPSVGNGLLLDFSICSLSASISRINQHTSYQISTRNNKSLYRQPLSIVFINIYSQPYRTASTSRPPPAQQDGKTCAVLSGIPPDIRQFTALSIIEHTVHEKGGSGFRFELDRQQLATEASEGNRSERSHYRQNKSTTNKRK